jgi:hypothetical protein
MSYPDLAHRVLAAIRIWSVIEYFYPYKSLISDWNATLAESLPRFIAAANEDEYAAAVLQMVARVEDGHSGAFGHPATARLLGAWRAPIVVRQVENEFVVTALHAALPTETDVRIGDRVISVDGEPLRARVDRLRPYLTASTETARINRLLGVALAGPRDSTATLSLRGADGRTRTVPVARTQAFQPRVSGEPYRILENSIGYVDLTRLTVSQVDAMFEAFQSTRAIIFDMRGYPNGTAWSIAPRINTKEAKVGAVFRRAQVSGAATFEEAASGFFFEQPLPTSDKPKYTGKTVMLIDDRAISQAEHSALFFEAANGTPSSGLPRPARMGMSRDSSFSVDFAWASRAMMYGMPTAASCNASAFNRISPRHRRLRAFDLGVTRSSSAPSNSFSEKRGKTPEERKYDSPCLCRRDLGCCRVDEYGTGSARRRHCPLGG